MSILLSTCGTVNKDGMLKMTATHENPENLINKDPTNYKMTFDSTYKNTLPILSITEIPVTGSKQFYPRDNIKPDLYGVAFSGVANYMRAEAYEFTMDKLYLFYVYNSSLNKGVLINGLAANEVDIGSGIGSFILGNEVSVGVHAAYAIQTYGIFMRSDADTTCLNDSSSLS
jgi:hypothetical protein